VTNSGSGKPEYKANIATNDCEFHLVLQTQLMFRMQQLRFSEHESTWLVPLPIELLPWVASLSSL